MTWEGGGGKIALYTSVSTPLGGKNTTEGKSMTGTTQAASVHGCHIGRNIAKLGYFFQQLAATKSGSLNILGAFWPTS